MHSFFLTYVFQELSENPWCVCTYTCVCIFFLIKPKYFNYHETLLRYRFPSLKII